MPTATFTHLPPAKRDAFLAAAIDEFADRDPESASVSRIVARLGIAKGSLYQYFADKQDLYAYLVEHCQTALLEALGAPPADADLFASLRHLMAATVDAARRHPREAALLERAYRDPGSLPADVIARGLAARHERLRRLIDTARQAGEIDPAGDSELVTLMVEGVIAQVGPWLDARLPPGSAERYGGAETDAAFDQAIALLRHGLWGPDH